MKRYIIYIATLLAALALPANGQTAGTDTKAAPGAPAMPYKLSLVTIGGNNGTVAVEDNDPSGNGMTIVGSDTLFYGAPAGDNANATTVKLTITPNPGYIIRKGYPKGYKTGGPRPDNALPGSSPYTFKMPYFPLTVEVAYANPITSIAAITLKEAATADNAVSKLPAYIHITLGSGRKDSLKVASPDGWAFKASGDTGTGTATYDDKPGAVNRFTATLVANAFPDSIANEGILTAAGETYTAEVLVANLAEALKPAEPDQSKDKGLVVSGGTGDNLNGTLDEGEVIPFNGTVKETEVKSLKVDDSVKDAILTLKDVKVSGDGKPEEAKTDVNKGASLTLRLEGTNTLGTLTVESGALLVLDKAEGAKLEVTTISNSGIFRDSTATVKAVAEGIGKLAIDELTGGGKEVTPNTKVTLTASCTDKAGITSFIWQKRNDDGSYTVIQTNDYDANGTPVTPPVAPNAAPRLIETKNGDTFKGIKDDFEPATSSNGKTNYRCLIERTVKTTEDDGSETTAITLLSTDLATVEVKSGNGPVIPATYYTVTLPALEGFTSNPAPGQHSVEEGYSFSFSLTPAEGNTAPAPVVTTSRGETIQPRPSDGKYVISGIYEDITVSFASLPTANETMATEGFRIQSLPGAVYIRTPQPVATVIYTLSGQSVRKLSLPAGDSRIGLPEGFYIIRIGSLNQKVIVR